MAASTSYSVLAGGRRAHAGPMRLARDGHALAQHVLLVGGLDLAQVGDDRRRIRHGEPEEALAELRRELGRGAGRRRKIELRFEQHREPGAAVGQRLEELRVLGGGDSLTALGEHRGDERLELVGRHDRLDAACRRGLGRRQAVPVPVLAAGVRLAHEEHFLAGLVARHQHEDRVFLIDAGQVEQVAVLPVLVVDVGGEDALRRAPEDGDGIGAETFQGAGPPRLEIVLKRAGQGRQRDEPQQQGARENRAYFAHDLPRIVPEFPPFTGHRAVFAGKERRPQRRGRIFFTEGRSLRSR